MAHIIVVGAGVGGVPCAYELRKKLGKNHRVTLIGSSPYFEFTPSNPWVAVGWRKCENTRVDLREPLDDKLRNAFYTDFCLVQAPHARP